MYISTNVHWLQVQLQQLPFQQFSLVHRFLYQLSSMIDETSWQTQLEWHGTLLIIVSMHVQRSLYSHCFFLNNYHFQSKAVQVPLQLSLLQFTCNYLFDAVYSQLSTLQNLSFGHPSIHFLFAKILDPLSFSLLLKHACMYAE